MPFSTPLPCMRIDRRQHSELASTHALQLKGRATSGNMKRPTTRRDRHLRRPGNPRRGLLQKPESKLIEQLMKTVCYKGSWKHKMQPLEFGVSISHGSRGDATLCDEHAGFDKAKVSSIPRLIKRGLRAGLVGRGNLIWTVGDDGWIFEGRPTNVETSEYHGYPVLGWEPIARPVYVRYSEWAQTSGIDLDRIAAEQCRVRYGF